MVTLRRRSKRNLDGEATANWHMVPVGHLHIAQVKVVLDTRTAHSRPRVQDTIALRKHRNVAHLEIVHPPRLVDKVDTCNTYRHGACVTIGCCNRGRRRRIGDAQKVFDRRHNESGGLGINESDGADETVADHWFVHLGAVVLTASSNEGTSTVNSRHKLVHFVRLDKTLRSYRLRGRRSGGGRGNGHGGERVGCSGSLACSVRPKLRSKLRLVGGWNG